MTQIQSNTNMRAWGPMQQHQPLTCRGLCLAIGPVGLVHALAVYGTILQTYNLWHLNKSTFHQGSHWATMEVVLQSLHLDQAQKSGSLLGLPTWVFLAQGYLFPLPIRHVAFSTTISWVLFLSSFGLKGVNQRDCNGRLLQPWVISDNERVLNS